MRVAAIDLGHEHDAPARRGRRRRPRRRGLQAHDDHPARRGRRRAPPAPPAADRARPQLPLRLPPRIEALGAERALLVATSAVRDAENGEAFLGEVEWSYGFTTRLLTGEEEAELTLRGASGGRDLPATAVVIDIGGGSTELITAHERVSTDLGSVRLTERFLASDPPTEDELDTLAAAVRSVLSEQVPEGMKAQQGIGVAGTITSLAALDLGLVDYDP